LPKTKKGTAYYLALIELTEDRKGSRIEEIRALFILGLLAVLASVRTQTINAPTQAGSFPLNPIIDITIMFMSLYALFMVFGYSKDLIGETVATIFRSIAIQFVILNFVLLITYGIIYAIEFYQSRFLWMIVLIAIPCIYAGILKIRSYSGKKKEEPKSELSLEQKLLLIIKMLAGFGIVISALMIANYASEEMVPYFFMTGATFMVFWLIAASLIKKQKEEQTVCDDPL
jgi:hypothetical protein